MGEIRCKNSNGTYYLSPGAAITSVPAFGGTSASFTPGTLTTVNNITYTYINKIVKGSNSSYYFSDISAGLIKNLYASKTVYISGTATNLLYRRYTKIYYGFVAGQGGSKGSKGSYMADDRMGGGGGAGGSCIFIFSVASDTTPTFTSSSSSGAYTLTVTCDGYTMTFTGSKGGNGGSGSSSCTGDPGGGGGGGSGAMVINGTTYTNTTFTGQYGPFYIVATSASGTSGAKGGTWGDVGDASDKSFSFTDAQCAAIGLASGSIKWSRADGQNGSSAAPGVIVNGSTSWYGSGGSQSGTTQYWEATYSLE